MKRILLMSLILVVAACSNNEETTENKNEDVIKTEGAEEVEKSNSNNLIDLNNLNEGFWINYQGNKESNSNYVTTDFITLDTKKDYVISHNSYVSYYDKANSHIETVRLSGDDIIEKDENKQKIKVSFTKDRIDYINLNLN